MPVAADFDAAALCRLLAEAGVKGAERIVGVRRHPVNLQGTSALLLRLFLTCEGGGRGEVPETLVLKTAAADPAAAAFAGRCGHYRREVRFYRDIAPVATAWLPRCYSADLGGERFHLLLEDCRPGRVQHLTPLGLDHRSLTSAVDWLAGFHAQWTRAPEALAGIAAEGAVWGLPDERRAADFLAVAGDHLSAAERQLFEAVLDAWPALEEMVAGVPTLRHGDYHPGNIFFGRYGAPLVVDWQFCEVGSGTMDLVDLLCLHCHPQDRRLLSEELLRHYWKRLRRAGGRTGTWEETRRDFRVDVARALLKPAFLAAIPSLPAWAAVSRFKQAALAFADLDCRRLLPVAARSAAA